MHTTSLSRVPVIISIIGFAVASSLFGAALAKADNTPTVTVTVLTASNATTTSAQIGSLVHASVMVASSTGSTTPSGTVNFIAFNTQNCTGASITQSGVGLIGGIATSMATSVPTSGLSFIGHYNGDINYPAADSTCQPLVATNIPLINTPGTISGSVFNDLNKNDVKDVSEPGLSGWTVWLHQGTQKYDSPTIATTMTDSNGNYAFWTLAAGTYFVEQQVQSGWNQTTSDTAVVLNASTTVGGVNFANVMNGNISTTSTGKGEHGHGGDTGDNNHHDDMSSSTDQGHGYSGGTDGHDNHTATTTDQGHNTKDGHNNHNDNDTTTDQGHNMNSGDNNHDGNSGNNQDREGNQDGNQNTHTDNTDSNNGHQNHSYSQTMTDNSHNNDNNSDRGGRNHDNH